jgi:hypothetical protein
MKNITQLPSLLPSEQTIPTLHWNEEQDCFRSECELFDVIDNDGMTQVWYAPTQEYAIVILEEPMDLNGDSAETLLHRALEETTWYRLNGDTVPRQLIQEMTRLWRNARVVSDQEMANFVHVTSRANLPALEADWFSPEVEDAK